MNLLSSFKKKKQSWGFPLLEPLKIKNKNGIKPRFLCPLLKLSN